MRTYLFILTATFLSLSADLIVITVTTCTVTDYSFRLLKSATADGAAESELTRLVDVSFDVEWNAVTSYFDFDVDLHPNVLCDAAAREPWSRKFFNNLRAYVPCPPVFLEHCLHCKTNI